MLFWYVTWLAVSGLTTFLAYGWDKTQARRRRWRISERTLHLMALIGGVVGAWLGRATFRHKTLHASFTLVLILATAIHAGILAWLLLRG